MATRKTTAAAKAAPAIPESGPLCRIFGVRHLSPMGAFHLAKYLATVDPTAVLVEGPSDATENIVHLADKRTKPPVALLAFTRERPVRSILFPLAEYSPEWVALTWALKKKRVARFIDLPAETFLARTAAPHEHEHEGEDGAEPTPAPAPTDTQAYLADPYGAIAELTGEPDHDTWWEKNFEHTTADDAYRQSIFEFGAGLRSIDYEGPRRREETLLREAFMRRAIRDTLAEGHDPARVVVVCGAYHAPVLTAEEPAMTDAERAALPRVPTVLTLMPYSYYRLSAQSGYGAGNAAPGYFQALWEELRAGSTARLAPRYLSEVAGRLRKAGTIRSSAEVIEAVRLAEAMAAVRGDASAPTLRDLRDAAVTCLGQGDPAGIQRWLDDVAVGDALGKVPPGVLRTALQDDFYRTVEDLRLDKLDYLKEGQGADHQGPEGQEEQGRGARGQGPRSEARPARGPQREEPGGGLPGQEPLDLLPPPGAPGDWARRGSDRGERSRTAPTRRSGRPAGRPSARSRWSRTRSAATPSRSPRCGCSRRSSPPSPASARPPRWRGRRCSAISPTPWARP